MAPISTYVNFFALALVTVSTSGVAGALHNTRSRQHSQALAARRVTAVSERSNDSVSPLDARAEEAPKKKKRCSKHKKGKGKGKGSSSAAPTPAATSSSAPQPTVSSSSTGTGGVSGLTHVTLPSNGFNGKQTGGIGSWFDADSSRDSTNGVSWCNIPYTNDMPLFAPDMTTMSPSLATYSSNAQQWEQDATTWCGLEALVTYNGKTIPLYIGDAFAPEWVRTPASIDILQNSWSELYGSSTEDKDIVLSGSGFTWELTGYRNEDYAFKSSS